MSSAHTDLIPDLVTLDGFNNWLEERKFFANCCRLSKRKTGVPYTYPPPGLHIVIDDQNIHHDSVRIHSDDSMEFYPTNSAISTVPISNKTHPYVQNIFNNTYFYRTIVHQITSTTTPQKRKRYRKFKKKKKRK